MTMMRIGVILGAMALAATSTGAFAAGDAAKGKTVFARCMACHKTVAGQNGLGPSMAGIVGRKAATVAGFNYSPAMKGSGLTWTTANLDAYLTKPTAKVPGTRMIFMGIPKPEDRENLIAYLATLK
ncbi:c-type cytochrome [Sphingomonas crocodyli]|uniref:Cytochrome c family protein n=1 Tax=Sphingomonas crocodyli TaxID=1979270 RepID=A0A437MAU9_9SPHN|nr:cytochrome c family protein [Sphingomonas crocodyli]RVT94762.1 cytochrome c family protein [Sphingomonas crocodyli]